MKGFCWLVLGLVFCACGESGRGDDGFTVEQVASDTGFAEFDAELVDSDVAVDATVEDIDAQSDIDVDASAISVDAERTPTLDASPDVDARLIDALPPTDDASFEDAGPDSPDSVPDVNLLDAEVEDGSILDADTQLDPDAAPIIDEGVPQVDADPVVVPTPPLCENAGVRFESLTPSDQFPGQPLILLDYGIWRGQFCFDGECHEGMLDPPDTRYPTALITDQYRIEWSYMLGAGQFEDRILVFDLNGILTIQITGLRGPAGMMRSPGQYDDFGRYYTGPTEVNHPDRENTEVKIQGGESLTVFTTCRPDRL